MNDTKDSTYRVPDDKIHHVLKVLSNRPRFKILSLLTNGPMSISQIAKKINISQPTVTAYVNQLEDAGLVFTRLQKSSKGYSKLCFTIYNGIALDWEQARTRKKETEYDLDMPVGHYASIEGEPPSLLANQAGVIASSEDFSRFFHPVRMEGELLVLRNGEVRYLFPYNVPDKHKILSIELSAEMNLAFKHAQAMTSVTLSINDQEFSPVQLTSEHYDDELPRPGEWYPKDLATCGRLFVWHFDEQRATLNSQVAGDFRLDSLRLAPMQPIEVIFRTVSSGDSGGGVVVFGKTFGRYNQDIRLSIVYEPETKTLQKGTP